jgi:hypothetical protein
MIKYNVLGGGQIEATTDFGIINALREDAKEWIPSASIEEFMQGMAERCMTQKGVLVRTDYFVNFVADLIQYGFISRAE